MVNVAFDAVRLPTKALPAFKLDVWIFCAVILLIVAFADDRLPTVPLAALRLFVLILVAVTL